MRSIENVRTELHSLAIKLGLDAPSVLAKSIELDILLNQYDKERNNKISCLKD